MKKATKAMHKSVNGGKSFSGNMECGALMSQVDKMVQHLH